MMHVPVFSGEVTEENLAQATESVALSQVVMFRHWEALVESIARLCRDFNVPEELAKHMADFASHCTTAAQEHYWDTAMATMAIRAWVEAVEEPERTKRKVAAFEEVLKAKYKVAACHSDEDLGAVMAEWDWSESTENADEFLASLLAEQEPLPPELQSLLDSVPAPIHDAVEKLLREKRQELLDMPKGKSFAAMIAVNPETGEVKLVNAMQVDAPKAIRRKPKPTGSPKSRLDDMIGHLRPEDDEKG